MKTSLQAKITDSLIVEYALTSDKIIIGSMLIAVRDYGRVDVLHIFVTPKYRRDGHALSMIKALQGRYEYITTGWDDSSSSGRDLFLAAEFRVVKPLTKKVPITLEWEKEYNLAEIKKAQSNLYPSGSQAARLQRDAAKNKKQSPKKPPKPGKPNKHRKN